VLIAALESGERPERGIGLSILFAAGKGAGRSL
jgi:hypothetical protein